MTTRRRRIGWLILLLPLYAACSASHNDWRTASREPVGLAPDPAKTPEAVVQVYAARTINWKGYFGVHTWIAVKRSGASEFTVHEVIGYRLQRDGTTVVSRMRPPDSRWFGAEPDLLKDVRGPGVDALIDRIDIAIQNYPYNGTYRIWPGPNSNTFTAFVLRDVPELRVDLPPTAIGKDYLGIVPVALTPSGTGAQVNLFGVAGIAAGWEEGVELNLLGLTFGIDPASLSIKLPLLGRIGPDDHTPVIIP
ncbi:DUF3750 domain-containing protein [Steroidobacter flavus]|uniref:DUF3750 domain-containing protein n=1 Tax=Steroidobacter flavus TaxID=1842136 RepID=A0ABV8T0P2_9GAMM